MAKRFKLKLSRMITSSFNSCRSKHPSTIPSHPVPSFLQLSPVKLHLPPQPTPPSIPHYSSIKRHMSCALASISSGFRSRSTTQYLSETNHTTLPPPPATPEFHWEKEEKWHVVAKMYDQESPRRKIYNSLFLGDQFNHNNNILLPLPPPKKEKKRRRPKKKKNAIARNRISSSSADSGMFSTEGLDEDDDIDNDETETLVSSTRSLSTDYSSPEFNTHLETIRESPFSRNNKHTKKKVKKAKRYITRQARKNSTSDDSLSSSPARLSRFQRLIPCAVEGKVRESFAVEKKSEDPYEDFKRSMMEMIMEKQMFEVSDLEQLLQCFLSLNSRDHHGVIIEAFSEIWETLFCTSSVTCEVS